jgi:hypothetical protein
LETAGRAGNWNPHLHILMTSGGVTPTNRWREVSYFPYEERLFAMFEAGI